MDEELWAFWVKAGYDWSKAADRSWVTDREFCHQAALVFAMGVISLEALE